MNEKMTIRNQHRHLYKKIPNFQCKPNCTGCCGPVPISPWEAERLGIPGQPLTPTKPGTLKCTFATDTGCSVYNKRPFMCRLFGTADTPLLKCPYSCQPKKPLTDDQAGQLSSQYENLITRQY